MNSTKYLVFIVMIIIWALTSYFFAAGNKQDGHSFATGWLVGTITFWTVISIYSMASIIAGGIALWS